MSSLWRRRSAGIQKDGKGGKKIEKSGGKKRKMKEWKGRDKVGIKEEREDMSLKE